MAGTALAYAVCDPFDEFAASAHQVLQQWLENLRPTFASERQPTLQALSKLFTETRGELLGGCLRAAIEELYRPQLEETTICCKLCGKQLKRKRLDPKGCSTLHGEFELHRPYFYCAECCWASHPVDLALGLSRRRHQYDIQEEVVRLAADLPYETAAEHLCRLTGLKLGNHFAFDVLNAVTDHPRPEDVIPSPAELKRSIDEAVAAGADPILVVAIDGAHTPIRPPGGRQHKRGKGEWKETKGLRLYLCSDSGRITHLVSWHRNGDKQRFAADLARITPNLPEIDIPSVAVADGAPWIWKLVSKHFPKAQQVLDYYHCSEHIHAVASEQQNDAASALEWAEATLARLSLGRVSSVIAGLKRTNPRTAAAREAIRKLIGYLDTNRDRVAYGSYRSQGIPRGSGGIESANKFIHHCRLKRSGAWWLKPNANRMLAIRCAVRNGTFTRLISRHVAFQATLMDI